MRLFMLVACLIALSAIPALIFGNQIDTGAVLEFFRSESLWISLLGVAAISVDLVVPFPAHAIMTSFGMTQGWFVGGLLGSAGTFTAGILAYWLCRLLGQRAVSFIAGDGNVARLASFFNRYGLWSIAVSRWIPVVPEVVSSLAGATRMPYSRFLTGNLIGSLSVGFAYAALGSMSIVPAYILFTISVAVPVLMFAMFSLFLARSY
jgi:uncharacterized membrane protein YdjX (TVP38/TMEM64 family)